MRTGNEPIFIPTVRVHPNMLTIYSSVIWPNGRPTRYRPATFDLSIPNVTNPDVNNSPAFNKEKAYSGQLTNHSKKRLRSALNLLVAQAKWKTAMNFATNTEFKFKVNFVTLTLPSYQGSHDDKYLKSKCFDPWLKTMRRRYNLHAYVWRAERQYNGNVHFHITTDTYLPFDQIKQVWNHQIGKLDIMDRFEKKNGHRHPNSTDVHSVQKIKNVAAYMVKYMSKDPKEHLAELNAKRAKAGRPSIDPSAHHFRSIDGQPTFDQPISGKVWDCSQNLKTKDSCTLEIDSRIDTDLRDLEQHPKIETLQTEHCFLIFLRGADPAIILSGPLLEAWLSYISRIQRSP